MAHKEAIAKLDSDLALSAEPWHTHVGMSDQEIRTRALECATRLYARNWYEESDVDATFWEDVGEFENYIKTGERK